MEKKQYPTWIDGCAKAVYKFVKSHETKVLQPFNGMNLFPLFADFWLDKIYQPIKKFNAADQQISDIIDVLPTNSSLKYNLFSLINMFPMTKMAGSKIKEIVDFFAAAINERSVSRQWWETNIIHQFNDIEKLAAEKKLIKADLEQSKEVAKLVVGCNSLANALFNDLWLDYGYDVLGPYSATQVYGPDQILFVKQFNDLKAQALWPSRQNFPIESIMVYQVYKNVTAENYFIGCHTLCQGNLVEALTHFQVEIDNVEVTSVDRIRETRDVIFESASNYFMQVKQADFEQQKKLFLFQICYQFKKLFDYFNLDWQPSEEMWGSVANKQLTDYIDDEDDSGFSLADFAEHAGFNYLKSLY